MSEFDSILISGSTIKEEKGNDAKCLYTRKT